MPAARTCCRCRAPRRRAWSARSAPGWRRSAPCAGWWSAARRRTAPSNGRRCAATPPSHPVPGCPCRRRRCRSPPALGRTSAGGSGWRSTLTCSTVPGTRRAEAIMAKMLYSASHVAGRLHRRAGRRHVLADPAPRPQPHRGRADRPDRRPADRPPHLRRRRSEPGHGQGGPVRRRWAGPQFVLTHHAPDAPAPGVTFLDDLAAAVAAAKAAAGEKSTSTSSAPTSPGSACRPDCSTRSWSSSSRCCSATASGCSTSRAAPTSRSNASALSQVPHATGLWFRVAVDRSRRKTDPARQERPRSSP